VILRLVATPELARQHGEARSSLDSRTDRLERLPRFGFFRNLGASVLGTIGDASTWLLDVGKRIVDGLVSGIKGAGRRGAQRDQGPRAASSARPSKIFGIGSPSRCSRESAFTLSTAS